MVFSEHAKAAETSEEEGKVNSPLLAGLRRQQARIRFQNLERTMVVIFTKDAGCSRK